MEILWKVKLSNMNLVMQLSRMISPEKSFISWVSGVRFNNKVMYVVIIEYCCDLLNECHWNSI